jgi:glycosyltransferase TcdB-like subunit of Tc toxinin
VDDETGDWRELDWSLAYWSGDPQYLAHTEATNTFLRTLTDPRHRRDALRTLRGSTLRTELYALDGTDRQDRPYTVTERPMACVKNPRRNRATSSASGSSSRTPWPNAPRNGSAAPSR